MLKTKSGNLVSEIGIGTYTIEKENLKKEAETLNYYFNKGINYIDVVLSYDDGGVLDVISEFLKSIKREDIFINVFITRGCKNIEDIENQLNAYIKKLNLNYFDCVTLHTPFVLGFSFDDYVKEIQRLQKRYQILNIGYSNLSPKQLKKVLPHISYFEGLYNLENKMNEDNNIINDCIKNHVPFYAYQPLRRNRTAKQNYKEVVSLANKYGKTQNQILINWLVKHKLINILIKSSQKSHINENLDALNFEMDEKDYIILDEFRNAEFDKVQFNYNTNQQGKVRIEKIPNLPIGAI